MSHAPAYLDLVYSEAAQAENETILARPLAAVFVLVSSIMVWSMIWYIGGFCYGLARHFLG